MDVCLAYDIIIMTVVIAGALYMSAYYVPPSPQAYACAPGFDYNFL